MYIQSKRLKIEEAQLGDASFFYDLLNSPNWIQYIGDRGIHSIKDAEQYIQENLINSYNNNGFGLYKLSITSSNTAIGCCGFLQREQFLFPDLGFAILPEFENQGFASEAANSLIDWYKNLKIHSKLLSFTTPTNKASKKVLGNLGFTFKEEFHSTSNEKMWLYELSFG